MARSQRHQHGPVEWGMARVQPNGTQIAPNCSKTWPGKIRVGCKACHVMHSKYLVKINEGAKSAKKPFSFDIHRGETVPSLALKLNFLLQTTAHWPVCFAAPTYHVLSSKHIPTVQVHSVSNQMLFSFHATTKKRLCHKCTLLP